MLEYLRYRWKIARLQRAIRADEEGTKRAVEDARRRGAAHEVEEIEGGSDAPVLRYKLRQTMSSYLEAQADRLFIPLPDLKDHNKWTVFDNGRREEHVLSREGIDELRSKIRTERKARAERFLMWSSGIVGILGALIGLASMLVGRGK
jgi:hypothetical protein